MNVILEMAIGFYIVVKLCHVIEARTKPGFVSLISSLGIIVAATSIIASVISTMTAIASTMTGIVKNLSGLF